MRYKDAADKRTRYEQLFSALKTERSTFDAHWRDLGDYLMPRRTRFWSGDRNKGDKRNQHIINSTGRMSARTLASGLHSGLTSPARPWMKLTTPDSKLAALKPVKIWLDDVTNRMLTVFATSNLYNVLPLVYGDMGIFGTAAMSILTDTRDLFRAYSYPIGSYVLGMDERGVATTFGRDYELSVLQVVRQFGLQPDGKTIDWSTISSGVQREWDSSNYTTPIRLRWLVQPNPEADKTRLAAKYLPFASCHWEIASSEPNKTFLRESGFKSFPIMAPRWDITGEDSYGTDCPGMTALGDVRQLQMMERRKGQAIAKMVDPPLVGPSELRAQKTSLIAGDITYMSTRGDVLKPIHEVRIDIDHLRQDMSGVEYRIQRAFFEDLFLMLARSDDSRGAQPITAREVQERHEEKLLALGPVLERTNDELLDPIVDRVYQMMEDNGLLPEPPRELDGAALKVEYISVLAQAQKLVGVVAQDRFLQSSAGLIQVFPEVADKIDINQVVDNYGEMLGVDPRIIRTNDEANARVQQRAQATQAQQDAANAAQVAKAARDAANTPTTGDTVLAQLASNAQSLGSPGRIPPAPAGQAPAVPAGR
jgi:hypothetical protein